MHDVYSSTALLQPDAADKAQTSSETSENQQERTFMNWSTPSYQDLRFGFEINLYINNR
ncbi:MAG: pyrroloquinoline quinone precursor peptide PqqA [Candidatus Thiodiazotropha sp.]